MQHSTVLEVSVVLLAVGLMLLLSAQMLRVLSLSRTMGPMVIMLYHMLIDALKWLVLVITICESMRKWVGRSS